MTEQAKAAQTIVVRSQLHSHDGKGSRGDGGPRDGDERDKVNLDKRERKILKKGTNGERGEAPGWYVEASTACD